MAPRHPRIRLPAPPPPRPRPRTHTRLAYMALELLLTACLSAAILLALLRLGAGPRTTDADAAPLGVLRITGACTVLVYLAVEGGAALVRRVRRGPGPGSTDGGWDCGWGDDSDGPGGALEAGWREPFAVARGAHAYGSVGTPFAMAPAGGGRAGLRP
ncbi:hypothetical protein B0H15DRAFT_1022282 [Mycena belliarum]|uniref:Uncharacterized protein n=1 Tax=Mycena belliarum TaxID=1033014 RepID=A0AAD6U5I5_9AGAR|nr:hypothetical protein B0H15DRAFT_1022282 [Mycena belliae]